MLTACRAAAGRLLNDEYALSSALTVESLQSLGSCLRLPSAASAANSNASASSGDECAARASLEVEVEAAESEESEARLACYLRAMGSEMRVDLDLLVALLAHVLKLLAVGV